MLRLGVHRIPAAILVLAGLTWQAQAACVFGTAPGCVQVAITNGDFETLPAGGLTGSCAGNGGPGTGGPGCRLTLNGPIPGWSITSSTYSGQFQPGPNYFPLPLPTGLTLGYTNGGTLAQTLTTPLQASTIYTLRVDIGRRLDDLYPNPAPVVQLYAGSTLIATATGVKPELGRFARWTARYQAGAADPLAGQMLRVVLTATTPQGDFDNVSLEAEPVAAPAPCTFTTAPAAGSAPAAGGTGTITVTASGSECAWTASSSAGWLTVTSGASGRGSGTVSYQVAANPGAARSGTITAAGRVFTLNQAAAAPAVPVPAIARGGILNAADYTADLAPGMMVSVWGQNLAPRTAVAEAVPLPLELDGVSVEVSEAGKAAVRAPLFFVSPGQINIQLPFGLTASTIQVRVRSAAGASNTETAALQQSSPRLFTRTMDGKGEPILLHAADYSWVSASAPAVPGEYVILLLTGLGPVSPAIDAGKPGGDDGALGPINWVRNEVAVTVGTAVIRPAFAGLMPRFPGVYQINFQVPAEIPSGTLPLKVSVGGRASQEGVAAAVGLRRLRIAGGTIDASGGAVSGEGFRLTVPAGAFAATQALEVYTEEGAPNPTGGRSGPVYVVEGLPVSIGAPLEVTFALPEGPAANTTTLAVVRGFAPMHASAGTPFVGTVAGNRVSFTIPPTEGDLPATAGSELANEMSPKAGQLPATISARVEGYTRVTSFNSPSGNFRLYYRPAEVPENRIAELASLFDRAHRLIEDIGLSWNGRTMPITVYVEYFFGNDYDKWGYQLSTVWGVNYSTIHINSRLLAANGMSQDMRATAGHELLHLAQLLYDPRNFWAKASSYGPWGWYNDAICTWFETAVLNDNSYIPSTVRGAGSNNFEFMQANGLEVGLMGESVQQEHGYGASMFLRHLSNAHRSNSFPASALKRMLVRPEDGSRQSRYLAADSIHMQLRQADLYAGIGSAWRDFIRSYAAGNIYQVNYPTPDDLVRTRRETFMFRAETEVTHSFSWVSPDLSARWFTLQFRQAWPAGTKLHLQLTDPNQESEMLVYRYRAGAVWSLVGTVTTAPLVIENADTLQKNGDMLVLVTSNGRAVSPYGGSTPMRIDVRVDQPVTLAPKTYTDTLQAAPLYNNSSRANVQLQVTGPGLELTQRYLGGGPGSTQMNYTFSTPARDPAGPADQTDSFAVRVDISGVTPAWDGCLPGSVYLLGGFEAPYSTRASTFTTTVNVKRAAAATGASFSISVWCLPKEGRELVEVSRLGYLFSFYFRPR